MDEQGDLQLESLAISRSNKANNQGKNGITEVVIFVIQVSQSLDGGSSSNMSS